MVTCSYTTTGKGVLERMVTLGGSNKLVDLQSVLHRDGDGPTQQLGGRDRQNQADLHNRRRPAVRHQQITAIGLWAMV